MSGLELPSGALRAYANGDVYTHDRYIGLTYCPRCGTRWWTEAGRCPVCPRDRSCVWFTDPTKLEKG